MRFQIETKLQRLQRRRDTLIQWHRKFAWFPVRMTNDPTVVVFFEYVLRRGTDTNYSITNPTWKWEYAESTFDVLKMRQQ